MTEIEKKALENMKRALDLSTEQDKERVLAYTEGLAFMAAQKAGHEERAEC